MDSMPIFILASFGLLISPGADMILLTNNTINKGKGIGIITAIGTLSGAFVHILLVIVGVSTIIATSPILYNGLKWGGALYLIYVGITTLISSMGKSDPTVDNPIHHTGPSKKTSIYGQAFLINVLNPKVIIFFISFFPQFITKKSSLYSRVNSIRYCFYIDRFLMDGDLHCSNFYHSSTPSDSFHSKDYKWYNRLFVHYNCSIYISIYIKSKKVRGEYLLEIRPPYCNNKRSFFIDTTLIFMPFGLCTTSSS
ncbi:LysE family translocator [Halobacillus andaensis]|uniref:LysE family translocator n=1 Tax=Halobacillus andaensis TaxID=1176239 RepID=UPI003D758117